MLNKKRKQTEIFLVPDNLTYIVKGGRAPAKVKTIANLLRLRPVLGTKKGKLKARGVIYGKSKMVEKFSKYLTKKIKEDKKYRIMVAHSNCEEKGKQFLNQLLSSHLNITEHYLLELGGALGAHAGPNSLAVGFQEVD